MRIEREDTGFVLVDMQEKLVPHIYNHESIVHRIITLLEGMKALSVPVMAARQYPQGLGNVIEQVKPYFSVYWDKITFSCCGQPDFMTTVQNNGKKNMIVAGVEAHVCVLQTVIDLKQLGFLPVVVTDAIGSRKPLDYQIALKRMQYEGAVLTTTESILFELCRQAGSDMFKTISKLVK